MIPVEVGYIASFVGSSDLVDKNDEILLGMPVERGNIRIIVIGPCEIFL